MDTILEEITEQVLKIESLARDVLRYARNTLLVNLRFLDAALSRLQPTSTGELPLATDGVKLYYDPRHILRVYKDEREATVRDYLHVILHCVFRHMYIHTLVDKAAWDRSARRFTTSPGCLTLKHNSPLFSSLNTSF